MARNKECVDALVEHGDFKHISRGDIEKIVEEMDAIKTEAGDGFFEKADIRRKSLSNDLKVDRLRRLDQLVKNNRLDNLMKDFEDNPTEGIKALFRGSIRLSKGGNLSIDSKRVSMEVSLLGRLEAGLREVPGGMDAFSSGSNARDVMMEAAEIRPGGKPGITNNKLAKDMAQVINRVNRDLLLRYRAAGINIGEVNGYIMMQSHDATKMTALGDASKENWVNFLIDRLDHERTFGDRIIGNNNKIKYLNNLFDEIIKKNENVLGGGQSGFKGRSLHFKSGGDFFDYNVEFGRSTLPEALQSSIHRASKLVSIVDTLGNDYIGSLKRLVNNARKNGADIREPGAGSSLPKDIQNFLDDATGVSTVPGKGLAVKALRGARQWTAMVDLGGATLAAVPDWTMTAAALTSNTGKNFLQAHVDVFSNYLNSFGAKKRTIAAQRMQLFHSVAQSEMFGRSGMPDDANTGKTSWLLRKYFKYTGLSSHTEISQTAFATTLSNDLYRVRKNGFNSLNPKMRAGLERFNIDSNDWKIITSAVDELELNFGKTSILSPESIKELPDEAFEGIDLKGRSIESFRVDVEQKYSTYLTENARSFTLQQGAAERVMLSGGLNDDEVLGQIAKLVTQYKGVAVSSARNVARIGLSDPSKNAKSFGDILKMRGDNSSMAQMLAGLTASGYLVMILKAAAKNNTPPDHTDPRVFMDAFIKGGGGGLAADFLFADYSSPYRNLPGTAVGPVISKAGDLVKFLQGGLTKDGGISLGDAFKFGKRNAPFLNTFYLKGALEWSILDNMQESLEPGSSAKRNRRELQRLGERGQRKIF